MSNRHKNREHPKQDNNKRRLYYLHELDNRKVHHNDPDIRGWEVYAGDEKVGRVDNLLTDIRKDEVRYVDVEVRNHTFFGDVRGEPSSGSTRGAATTAPATEDRIRAADERTASTAKTSESSLAERSHMLLPIGVVRLNKNNQHVEIQGIDTHTIRNLPNHRPGFAITPAYEIEVYNVLNRSNTQSAVNDYSREEYQHRSAMEDKFYTTSFFATEDYRSNTRRPS
mgnify:CR=1 FL=1